MRRGLDLVLCLVVLATVGLGESSADLRAQTVGAPPTSGTRLRVWSPDLRDRAVIGVLVESDSARLTLERSDATRFIFPWPRVDSVQVSRGRTGGRGRQGALLGGLVGGAVLAIVAGTSGNEGDLEVIDPGAAAGVAFVAGALGGAIVGGLIGSARATDRWESVPLRPRAGMGAKPSLPSMRLSIVWMRFR